MSRYCQYCRMPQRSEPAPESSRIAPRLRQKLSAVHFKTLMKWFSRSDRYLQPSMAWRSLGDEELVCLLAEQAVNMLLEIEKSSRALPKSDDES